MVGFVYYSWQGAACLGISPVYLTGWRQAHGAGTQGAEAGRRQAALFRETVRERLRRGSADERIRALLERHPERLGTLAVPGFSANAAGAVDPRFFAGPGQVRALMLTGAELDPGECVVRCRKPETATCRPEAQGVLTRKRGSIIRLGGLSGGRERGRP